MPCAAVPKPVSSNLPSLYLGLMSGTSLDGVDAVLAEVGQTRFRVLGYRQDPFDSLLKTQLLALCHSGSDELERAHRASVDLARVYATTVKYLLQQFNVDPHDIAAMGCHGQTVRHRPAQGYSVQLVNGAWLAELTGIAVVTDFRAGDLAAGGQGAPLVPAFHEARFRHPTTPRILLNLGGIANLTLLFPGQQTRGYDSGPANLLMDAWIQQQRGDAYDQDGAWAAQGQCIEPLLERLLAHPFFTRQPPKSTGREDFNLDGLVHGWPDLANHRAVDIQRTLLEVTAYSVAQAIRKESAAMSGVELFLCGGGARNGQLRQRLAALLPGVHLATTEALGMPVQQVEACAFAWLAWARLNGQSGNLPAVTGARHAVSLGALYSG